MRPKSTLFALACLALALLSLPAKAQYDKDVFRDKGIMALQDGQYAKAIDAFNVLARLDTTDYWNYFRRGIAKYNLGDLRGSLNDFDRSVRLNPVFTNGYHYRAIVKSRFGYTDEALKDIGRAIELRPGFRSLYYSSGVINFLGRRFEQALGDFNTYIKYEPSDPSAFLNRGATHLFLKDTLAALDDYNHAAHLDKFEAETYNRRGMLLSAMGRSEEAIADLNLAISLDPENTLAYFNRGVLHSQQNQFAEALEDYNEVLKRKPGNAISLYNRSLILTRIGDYHAALSDMDRVININPGNVLAYFNRAALFIDMNRYEDALKDYDKAIELFPDFAKAYMNRSIVNRKLGRMKASEKDYRTAIQKIEKSAADTTRDYSALVALDDDFSREDFNDEMLQLRDVDINLKPLYKFVIVNPEDTLLTGLRRLYENNNLKAFTSSIPLPVALTGDEGTKHVVDNELDAGNLAKAFFTEGLIEFQRGNYNTAVACFSNAVSASEGKGEEAYYLLNRAVLRAEMTIFIESMKNNVRTLSLDENGNAKARISEDDSSSGDYTDSMEDLQKAAGIMPSLPYIHYNLGNLHTLGSELVEAVEEYGKAIEAYPHFSDAYYNRGLVLILLREKEKGCIDLSRAGELGVRDAYRIINKYCTEDEN